MARFASEAERLRFMRESFTLALLTGCTPAEAGRELRNREVLARIESNKVKLAAMNAPRGRAIADESDRDSQPWMMRD